MFTLTHDQAVQVNGWLEECHKKSPNLGATGGAVTYEFTPTGLGTVVRVIFCHGTPMQEVLDLTDYDSW